MEIKTRIRVQIITFLFSFCIYIYIYIYIRMFTYVDMAKKKVGDEEGICCGGRRLL